MCILFSLIKSKQFSSLDLLHRISFRISSNTESAFVLEYSIEFDLQLVARPCYLQKAKRKRTENPPVVVFESRFTKNRLHDERDVKWKKKKEKSDTPRGIYLSRLLYIRSPRFLSPPAVRSSREEKMTFRRKSVFSHLPCQPTYDFFLRFLVLTQLWLRLVISFSLFSPERQFRNVG